MKLLKVRARVCFRLAQKNNRERRTPSSTTAMHWPVWKFLFLGTYLNISRAGCSALAYTEFETKPEDSFIVNGRLSMARRRVIKLEEDIFVPRLYVSLMYREAMLR